MKESHSEQYRAAGVDIEAGYQAVELIKKHVARTTRPEVLSSIGGFGAIFRPELAHLKEPLLISGTDGVGTKLRIAQLLDRHDSIGIDCVAMCVNDIAASGAEPLFFLDYIACGKNKPERIADIVAGVAEGCQQAGAALVGGETAEMPGLYQEDDYDLAGFAVGIVDRSQLIDGSKIQAGDVILGLASSGLHSNAYSLVRRILEVEKRDLRAYVPELGESLGEALLRPTRIYAKAILALREAVHLKGVAHITGGGFFENMPRLLPEEANLDLCVRLESWPIPPIFTYLQEEGGLREEELYYTFNMGIGMIVVLPPEEVELAEELLQKKGEKPYRLGHVQPGDGKLLLQRPSGELAFADEA